MARNPLAAAIPNAPLVDAAGNVAPVWRDWFRVLLSRTGGAVGVSAGDADARITAETAGRIAADNALGTALSAERTARDAADAAELAARVAADTDLATRVAANPPAVLLESGGFGAKISALPAFSLTTPPTGAEALPVVEAGATTAMTLAQSYTLLFNWRGWIPGGSPLNAPLGSNAAGTPVEVAAGGGDGTGSGGLFQLLGGAGGLVGGDGGGLELVGGNAQAGNGVGGHVLGQAGNGSGTGSGGWAELLAGTGGDTGPGGNASLTAGDGGITSGAGGSLFLTSGTAPTSGNGGDITITPGTLAGTGRNGLLILASFPTADPGVSGAVWVDTGSSPHTLRVSP